MVRVDSPVNCKIFLKYIPKDGYDYEMKELMLTQVFNYKISENKRPVYAFNKLDYQQVTRGKRLFEGVIVIKKSLISDISKFIDINGPDLKSDKKYIDRKIAYLKNFISENKKMESQLAEYSDRALEEYNKKVEFYINSKRYDIINELPEGASIIVAFGSYQNDEEFKDKYKNMIQENYYENVDHIEEAILKHSDFIIEDVNFFEKAGEINVSKTDIDEVYKFFGKLRIGSGY